MRRSPASSVTGVHETQRVPSCEERVIVSSSRRIGTARPSIVATSRQRFLPGESNGPRSEVFIDAPVSMRVNSAGVASSGPSEASMTTRTREPRVPSGSAMCVSPFLFTDELATFLPSTSTDTFVAHCVRFASPSVGFCVRSTLVMSRGAVVSCHQAPSGEAPPGTQPVSLLPSAAAEARYWRLSNHTPDDVARTASLYPATSS